MADLNRRKVILSIRARLALQCEICVSVGECHHCALNDCALGIPNNTGDGALVNLSNGHASKDTAEAQDKQESPYHAAFRLPQLNGSHFLSPPLSAVRRRTYYYSRRMRYPIIWAPFSPWLGDRVKRYHRSQSLYQKKRKINPRSRKRPARY